MAQLWDRRLSASSEGKLWRRLDCATIVEPALDIAFDMETRDPDDALALCLLACHPDVVLRAVTVNPGTPAQVGVVRQLLLRAGKPHLAVGARNPTSHREHVSEFHHEWLGEVAKVEPEWIAHELLAETFATHPDAVLVTGAPLHNLRLLLNRHPDVAIARWVAQGGFAGDAVVPPEHRLDKFAGIDTCPTFNFNGDKKAALQALASERISRRDLVSKNVTHGLVYDRAFHRRLGPLRNNTPGLALIYEAMECYLAMRPEGKMLHDPLAACVAIDPSIAEFVEVELYRERGEWGSRPVRGSNTFITISADRKRFFETFTRSRSTRSRS